MRKATDTTIKTIMSDPNDTAHLVNVINRHGRPEDQDKIMAVVRGNVLKEIQRNLNQAGTAIENLDINKVISKASRYGDVLAELDPKYMEEFNNFLGDLSNQREALIEGSAGLEQAIKDAETAKKGILNTVLGRFIDPHGASKKAGHQVLAEVFKDAKGSQQFDQLMTIAREAAEGGDNSIMEGLKASYVDVLRDALDTGGPSIPHSSGRAMNATRYKKQTRLADLDANTILARGEQIFADTPMVWQNLQAMLDENARLSHALGDNMMLGGNKAMVDAGAPKRDFDFAANKIIVAGIGVISRPAAIARSIRGVVSSAYDPEQLLKDAQDRVAANAGLVEGYMRQISKEVGRTLSKDARRAVEQYLGILVGNAMVNPSDVEAMIKELESAGAGGSAEPQKMIDPNWLGGSTTVEKQPYIKFPQN
jgi:hypothetical protein